MSLRGTKQSLTLLNMKKKLLTILLLISSYFANAQKELWGVNSSESYIDYSNPAAPITIPYNGNITKFDINGQNPTIVHEFTDFTSGKTPKGKLFLASNGKLYGTTFRGGTIGPAGSATENGLGVLYEYDLILNKYRVIHSFLWVNGGNPLFGVMEPTGGKLYGSSTSGGVYTYSIDTEIFTIINGSLGGNINNELMKSSNGYLYGTTGYSSNCPGITGNTPNYGSIFKVNTTTNTLQTVYNFKCDATDGLNINTSTGTLIEIQPGKLIGTVSSGFEFANTNNGNIFEFNTISNTFTKQIDFDGNNIGSYPRAIVNGDNGKLYGVCQDGGTLNGSDQNGNTFTSHIGTIFEYTPVVTNTIVKLHDFGQQQQVVESYSGMHPYSIMKASTGDYFGISQIGLYKFNPITNEVIMPIPAFCENGCPPQPLNASVSESVIEICRKPSYHEFTIDTYDTCVGDAFTFDVQNTNATTYVWKKDTIIVPLQTTGVLTINNVIASDSGTYTCTMTNECGVTVTMPLHLTVNCLGVDQMVSDKNEIQLYPNPAKTILNIKLPDTKDFEIQKLTIINLLGQEIYTDTSNFSKVDVSKMAKGIYQVLLKTNKGDWSKKFIKE